MGQIMVESATYWTKLYIDFFIIIIIIYFNYIILNEGEKNRLTHLIQKRGKKIYGSVLGCNIKH